MRASKLVGFENQVSVSAEVSSVFEAVDPDEDFTLLISASTTLI